MAVLWQLGVQHLEGFLIQAPEQAEPSRPSASAMTRRIGCFRSTSRLVVACSAG